jgi:ABC-2 type transport system ATP-binding protein
MNTPAIEVRNLEKHFPGFHLGPLSLTVPRGAIYGLIGPNGAGKSTTIDLLLGMGAPDAGQMRLLGMDPVHQEVEIKRRLAYVSPELNYASWGKVGRAVQFVRGFYPDWDQARCDRLLTEFRMGAEDKIATLSFGARTKLSLVLALSRQPDLIVLDEPTVGLDALSRQQLYTELLAVVQAEQRTVLLSSHNLADIERFGDHVGMIKEGKLLLEGRMDAVVDQHRLVDFETPEPFVWSARQGFRLVSQEPGRCRALVALEPGWRQWLEGRGARQIAETPMTLEELFLALMKN